ncbi:MULTISPECIES: helix-turn-helix domain-containing protein [unclassified Shinella]|jgi:AraC-like DNA-binding protein|uniref:AraC-like ligand-binding domain-containing protein n=1 Tax=unclassified Shinella TaxID=2643062 RepID=UPI0003C55270|nr:MULTISPECIES: helix-turn-helix domain-containing protein [unclassified Shinella]MCA0339370.1 helix-turn-helix domain-containing protein [Pseudomonadota bacterium]EYR79282.1 transcriptional activator NphR [Shinella sp. DD12]MCO5151241.1 helix-turn-helix domain-containing protein [Shinella sp.]MDC7265573.1 helix-turn-helix domain-containing protein [Shinella sp. HY16]MDC7272470.1 helix-turn-helix domain-containing protein [Shinella sp. YZ44]
MKTSITTSATRAPDRSRHWHEAIASAYFPLDLRFRDPDRFSGDLTTWQFGDVSISRLTSDALQYHRLPHHFRAARDEEFLVTVPAKAEVFFSQCGKDIRCPPGGFFLERSSEPYQFSHAEPADMWVLKVEGDALAGRMRAPDRFCTLQFEADNGAGGLFTDMLHLLPARFDGMTQEARITVGRQLVDLLVLAIKADDRVLVSGNSTVRGAHLARIEAYVRANLQDFRLDPERIARACGISTRYLHELFRDTGQTVRSWIRDQRLMACREALEDPNNVETAAEIAYRWGFGDQTQFSRVFKAEFGVPPGEFRENARAGRLS